VRSLGDAASKAGQGRDLDDEQNVSRVYAKLSQRYLEYLPQSPIHCHRLHLLVDFGGSFEELILRAGLMIVSMQNERDHVKILCDDALPLGWERERSLPCLDGVFGRAGMESLGVLGSRSASIGDAPSFLAVGVVSLSLQSTLFSAKGAIRDGDSIRN
jgi:hypothetical protein